MKVLSIIRFMNKKNHNVMKFIKDRLFMSKEYKVAFIDRNLIRVIYIAAILVVFSGFFIITGLLSPEFEKERMETLGWIYYSTILGMSFLALVLSIIFLKLKTLNQTIRNIPLFLLFIGFMILSYVFFLYGPQPFNAFLVFVIVGTIAPLVFSIEPIVYNTLEIAVYITMVKKLNLTYGFGGVMNVAIYVVVMNILGITRWVSLINKVKHNQLQEAHEKMIEQELEMASIVQKSFFNMNYSNIKNWEIACYNNPMISLSGDLFDFYKKDNFLRGLSIFDVSGHGLSAGLVTMLVKKSMEEEFYDNEDLELDFTMQRINVRIREEKGKIENYLTGIILRFGEDKIEMVNAGHPLPAIYKSDSKTFDYMKCSPEECQGAVGLGDLNFDFKTVTFNLNKDDRIVLYTDGILEAKNASQEQYGKNRFLESLNKHSTLSVQEQMSAVIQDVMSFIGTAPRTDDISIIILNKL